MQKQGKETAQKATERNARFFQTDEGLERERELYTEGFCQSGLNGSDYLIIVSDQAAETLTPYYSLLEAQTSGGMKTGALDALDSADESYGKRTLGNSGMTYEDFYWADGTDEIFVYMTENFVKGEILDTMNFIITVVAYACIYTAVVFLCVALTVLSVQQLGDSGKYRFRYDTLRKLGLRPEKIHSVIRKQLLIYYMTPFVVSAVISWIIVKYISDSFVFIQGSARTVFCILQGQQRLWQFCF